MDSSGRHQLAWPGTFYFHFDFVYIGDSFVSLKPLTPSQTTNCKVLQTQSLQMTILTLSQTTIFRLFQSLQTTISNLMKMEESSQDEEKNAVEKREIARYDQFLLFLQCFQKACTADT